MKAETETMDYTLLRQTIYRYRERFPFADYSVLARSWNGRAMFTLKLGDLTNPVLLLGGFDGRDSLTPRLLLRFFEKLCLSCEEDAALSGIRIRSVFRDKGVMILPCVNPDGLAQNQTGNAHGVNLAENYKPGWTQRRRLTQEPDSGTLYAGKTPESEPETRALLRAYRRYPFRHMMVLGRGARAITAYAPDCPEQKAEMMQNVFCAVGGFVPETADFSPGRYCGAAEQFAFEFRRPAFRLLTEGNDPAAAQLEETLILSCLM